MFNLLRSDLYRTVRMRSFWVLTLILVVGLISMAAFMSYLASPEFAVMVNDSISEQTLEHMTPEEQAEVRADLDEALEETKPLNDKVFASVTALWSNSFFDGGALGLVGSLFVALFLMLDLKCGFIKNLPMGRRERWKYYGEKIVFILIVQAYFLALCAGVCTFAFWVSGFTYEVADPLGAVILWLLLAWLYTTAFALLTACVVWLVRSATLGVLMAVIVSSGIFGSILAQVFSYFSAVVPWLSQVPSWLLVSVRADLRHGGATLLEPNVGYGLSMVPGWTHALVVSCAFVAVACVIVFAGCRKKDIA